jgi:uncharacterized SAM-binding protein YcdF (DUF218 family)
MFFYLSKILWFFTDPGNILLFCLCIIAALAWTKHLKVVKFFLFFTALFAVVVSVLPIGPVLFNNLENRFPRATKLPNQVTGIIVLGGVVDQFVTIDREQITINGAAERVIEFARLSFLYPNAKLVFSGGSGVMSKQDLKESDAVKPLLLAFGIKPNRVIYENQSRNTFENASLTKKLIKPKNTENWIVITSAFHMPRAIGTFRQNGWNVIAHPVDYHTLTNVSFGPKFSLLSGLGTLSAVIHEWLGLTFYWLSNRTNEFYPKP